MPGYGTAIAYGYRGYLSLAGSDEAAIEEGGEAYASPPFPDRAAFRLAESTGNNLPAQIDIHAGTSRARRAVSLLFCAKGGVSTNGLPPGAESLSPKRTLKPSFATPYGG